MSSSDLRFAGVWSRATTARRGVVALVVLGLAAPSVAGPWWKEAAPPLDSSLGPRCLVAAAPAPALGGVIVFGGGSRGSSTLYNESWIYDGVAWRRGPEAPPALTPRLGSALVHDDARDRHLLFGGFDGGWWRSDSWLLGPQGWSQLSTTGAIPPRAGHAMARDSRRDVTVVMGGYADHVWLGDVWELQGAAWTPGPTGPSRRTLASLVDHRTRGTLVLFGGYDGSIGTYHGDAWELDGAGWRPASVDAGPHPSPRSSMGAAYDPATGQMVLFGGKDGATIFDETWLMDGARWRAGPAAAAGMKPRVYMGMAHDPVRDGIVVFAGYDFEWMMGDAWELGIRGPRSGIVAAAGAGPANPPMVAGTSPFGVPRASIAAYGSVGFGATVAAGEVDGVPPAEIVTGPGPGESLAPHVRAFTATGGPLPGASFFAYGTHRHGVEVATGGVGELAGTIREAILTGAGPGATFAPHVRGFDLAGGLHAMPGLSFHAYPYLTHGVVVAVGAITTPGEGEMVTAPGPGPDNAASIRAFTWESQRVQRIASVDFNLPPAGHGGRVATGDADGDGLSEMIVSGGPGPGGSSRLVAYEHAGMGVTVVPGCDVTPFPSHYGVRVGAGELDLGAGDELLAAAGPDPSADSRVLPHRLRDGVLSPVPELARESFPGLAYGANVATADLGW